MAFIEWDYGDDDYITVDIDQKDFIFRGVKKVEESDFEKLTVTGTQITGGEFDKEEQFFSQNRHKHDRRQKAHTAWVREKTCTCRQQPDTTEMSMDNSKINLPARPAKFYYTGDISKISDKQETKYHFPKSSYLVDHLSFHQNFPGERGTKDEESLKYQCSQKSETIQTKSRNKFLSLCSSLQDRDTIQFLQGTTESEQKHEEIPQTKKIEPTSAYSVAPRSHNFPPFIRSESSGVSHYPCPLPSTDTSSSELFDSNESDDQRGSWSENTEKMSSYMHLLETLNSYKKEKDNKEKIMKSKKQEKIHVQQRKIIRARRKIFSIRDAFSEVSKPEAEQMNTDSSYRIVIVGTVGSGKSSLGNSLLGNQYFETGISGSSVTRKCSMGESLNHGRHITVVDTIGYTSEVLKKSKILKAFDKISPGPHAVLNVIPFSERFTSEFFSSIQQFVNLVGKEVYNYLVIVLTHEDQLEMKNLTMDEFIKSSPAEFKELLNRCENRIFAINNCAAVEAKHKKVKRLIKMIDTIKSKNTCFETYDEFLF